MRWLAILLVAPAFAGCTMPNDADAGPFTLELADLPDSILLGEQLTLDVQITGEGTATSDHIGAHYWETDTSDPDADFNLSGGCAHIGAEVPFEYTTTCDISEPGEYFVRAHLRVGDNNYWSESQAVKVLLDLSPYELTAKNVPPAGVPRGEAFTFTLEISGPEATSDHIGAHYWETSQEEPTAAGTACVHQDGSLPGNFDVTCTIAEPGTYYLRGHMRHPSGSPAGGVWTTEHVIQVQ